jgi:hypothetical protein
VDIKRFEAREAAEGRDRKGSDEKDKGGRVSNGEEIGTAGGIVRRRAGEKE